MNKGYFFYYNTAQTSVCFAPVQLFNIMNIWIYEYEYIIFFVFYLKK